MTSIIYHTRKKPNERSNLKKLNDIISCNVYVTVLDLPGKK